MDRRRYLPWLDGLEGRALLSLFGLSSSSRAMLQGSSQVANDTTATFNLKVRRIERLPFFLSSFESGRFLPKATIEHLQTDLLSIAAKLHPPMSQGLNNFNHIEREVVPHATLHQSDVAQLSHAFQVIVSQTGATTQQVSNLTTDLLQLAQVDAKSRNPAFLASNDYSTVLQVVLGVGKPIATPAVPTLAAKDQAHIKNAPGVTGDRQFTLVGTYKPAATILITTSDGRVLGTGGTDSLGKYRATVATPLPDGKYVLQLRALDAFGNFSPLSRRFVVRVISGPKQHMASGQAAAEMMSPAPQTSAATAAANAANPGGH